MNELNSQSVFKLRIVNVDYYLSEPIIGFDDNYSEFRESPISKVPIIRIFGTTPKGLRKLSINWLLIVVIIILIVFDV